MLIKMLTLQAGPKTVREAGKAYDVPDKEAKDLIAGGYAVEAKRGVTPQTATGRRGAERATPPESEPVAE